MSTGGDDGILSRWSRRKSATRARGRAAPVALEEVVPPPSANDDAALEEPTVDARIAPAAESARDDPELSQEEVDAIVAELPPIDSLDKDSDFTAFLQKGVPEELTKAALRKLWLSDSIFGHLDGLNEYDENYRTIDKLITLADTNYKVGKGFLTDDDDQGEDAKDPHEPLEDSEDETQLTAQEDGQDDVSDRSDDAENDPDEELGDDDPDLG